MRSTPEEKKQEAVERMKLLKIFPNTIKQFEDDGKLSQSLPPFGACYWVEGEQLQRVRDFEEKHNGLVYFVISGSYVMYGEHFDMEAYLYVCDNPEEWPLDRDDINGAQVCAYVCNLSAPDLSEIGAIGIEATPAGGLRRTW